jgi:hypothetical protein
MSAILRFLAGWIVGTVVTTAVAAFVQTQNVLDRLSGIGAEIGLGDRLSMTAYDVFHFGSFFIIFVSIATLIAYLAGLLVYRVAGFGRPVVFAVAGAVAMIVMLLLMKEVFFGVHLVGGARDGFGLALQMIAGALGGLAFARLTRRKSSGFRP